ncbi:MAG: PqqD family protein [Nitrospinae bacterium]|nr:PqqD family protein [Nitrospinota bacterium]
MPALDSHKPVRRNDLLIRDIEDESIIYDHTNNTVHSLNITAKFIWDFCDGRHELSEIAREITTKFNVDLNTAFRDIEETIEKFKENNLLQESPPDTTS